MSKSTRCPVCGGLVEQRPRGRPRRWCSRSCQARAYRSRRAGRALARVPRPARLSTVSITRAAIVLADRDGLDALTMRRLATELGVATASLYRHLPDRDALLAAMSELVLAEAEPGIPDGPDWRAELTARMLDEWRLYRRHPWMLTVLARIRPPLGPALFDVMERYVAPLDRLGVPPEGILLGYLTCSGLVQGLALLAVTEPGGVIGAPPDGITPETIGELLDPTLRPTLHALLTSGSPPAELELEDLLLAGITLLLDGIAVRHGDPSA